MPRKGRYPKSANRPAAGSSLVELMFTLGLAGVVLGMAVPSFNGVIESNRTTTVANRLLADLARVRSEAITAGANAVICPSIDSRTCHASADFSRGWIGFRDHDADAVPDSGEPVFAVTQASDLRARRIATTAGRTSLRFRSDGRSAGTNLTLRVCDANGVPLRVVIVNVGGRARIAHAPPTTAACPASP